MDYERLSRELIRTLRGRRSQPWLSRRVGLRSNLVYRWEAGRAWPTARQFFRVSRASGAHGPLELGRFLGTAPPSGLETSAGVAKLLSIIASPLAIGELAVRVGKSRFVASRWLSGKSEIRLPDLLRVVDVATFRLLDFLSVFTDPSLLPSAAEPWRRLQAARSAAYDVPWSHAVLRTLELTSYARKGRDESWIADRLGIGLGEVRRSLALLVQSGQIQKRRGHLQIRSSPVVDTSVEPERRRALRAFWSRVATERLERGTPGVHAFNLFTIAERDIPKLKELHAEYFERFRALVAQSSPPERLLLYAAQLVPLDERP